MPAPVADSWLGGRCGGPPGYVLIALAARQSLERHARNVRLLGTLLAVPTIGDAMRRFDWLYYDNRRRRKAEALASWLVPGLLVALVVFWACR